MRAKLVILVLLTAVSFLGAQSWREVLAPTYPGGTIFYDGFMVSKNVGYIVGSDGIILKTNDGGLSWVELNSGVSRTLYSIYFIDEQKGFVGGSSRTLLKTTNGGVSWDSVNISVIPDAAAAIYGLYFGDALNGWLVASTSSKGWILHTTDGGNTWVIDTTISKQLYAMHFAKPGKGIVVGKDAGTIWYTKDGITWVNAPAPDLSQFPYTRSDIRDVFMVNENLAFAVGWGTFAAGLQPSIILKTTNGGETWTQVVQAEVNRTYDNLYSVWFKDSLNGIAVGGGLRGSVVIKTTDGGNTWIPLDAMTGQTLQFVMGLGDTLIIGGSYGLIIRSPDFANSRELVTKIPGSTIYSMQIIGGKNIYTGGYNGVFLRSTNLGKTWEAHFVGVGQVYSNVNGIWFLNENVGYAACSYRLVAKTTDGGKSWIPILNDTLSTLAHCYDVFFIDENKGFAVGQVATNKDVIYKTTDGGRTWTATLNKASNAWRSVRFSTPQKGVIVGTKLKSVYTVDGGETWNASTFSNVPSSLASADLRSVAFLNDTVAIAVGNKIILRTTDAGKNWNYVDSTTGLLYSVSFADDKVGYAVGSGLVLKTVDGGFSWVNIYDGNVIKTPSIYSVAVDTSKYAWIGGAYSYIYTTAPVVSVEINNERPLGYELLQNYPNPFNSTTMIEFSIPERSEVTIGVYNLLGQEVARIVDSQIFEAGKHRISFRADDLPSGVYFYQLKADNFVQLRKMIYIK